VSYREHTSCISEAQKYQKSLYKAPLSQSRQSAPVPVAPIPTLAPDVSVKVKEDKLQKQEQFRELLRDNKVAFSTIQCIFPLITLYL
jgi:LYAR-type C2HC zinc finger